jgi:anti-sigma B factor antagonist
LTDTLVNVPTCSGHQRVAPYGELDLATAPALREQLVAASRSGAALVVLDLERVEFLDSVGVSVIVGGHKRLRHAGGRLHLAAPGAMVRKVLGLTRLDAVIPTYATVDEAEAGCPSEHTAA